ncbi:MAG: conjugal transfer protein TraD, partial [Sphingomonadales bacterium]|nr:conjugal transfer protein TraD [Sphingomonadales bacterium]
MSNDSDRRTHADAVRRHNRTNQFTRLKRHAGIMLATVATGAFLTPYTMLETEVFRTAAIYQYAQAKTWFSEGTISNPTMVIHVDGSDYTVPTAAVIAYPYYRNGNKAVVSKFGIGAWFGFVGWLAGLILLR